MPYKQILLAGDVVRTAEFDCGTIPVWDGSATITDATVSSTNLILVGQSGAAPTGKDQDENEMDGLECRAVSGSGSFTLYFTANPGPIVGKYKINYVVI